MNAIRTKYDAEREQVLAVDPKALDDVFIRAAMASIAQGADPVETWRRTAIALAHQSATALKMAERAFSHTLQPLIICKDCPALANVHQQECS